MEEIKNQELINLLTAKTKLNKTINDKIYDLLLPTAILAISELLDSPVDSFANFDVYFKDSILVLYMDNMINGEPHNVRIGLPVNIVFNSHQYILQFMKDNIEQSNTQEEIVEEDIVQQQPTSLDAKYNSHLYQFDLTLLTNEQLSQLKYQQPTTTRH